MSPHQGQGWFPQYQRRHFAHCQLPASQHVSCCCSSWFLNSLLIHCSTSLLYQRLLRPSLMGLGNGLHWSACKTIYLSYRWNCDVVHVDQGIVGTQQHAVVAVIEVNMVRISSVRFMKVVRIGERCWAVFSERSCRSGIAGIPARQRASGSHTPRRSRAKSWTPRSNLWGCLRSPVNDCPAHIPGYLFLVRCRFPRWREARTLLQASRISRSSSGPSKYSVWRTAPRGIPAFPDDGSGARKVASGFRIHQRTDGFDKIHTNQVCLLLKALSCSHGRRSRSAVSVSRTAHAAHAQGRRWLVLIRWPEGCQAIVEIRNSILRYVPLCAAHNASCPWMSWRLWLADEIDGISEELKQNGKIGTEHRIQVQDEWSPLTSVHTLINAVSFYRRSVSRSGGSGLSFRSEAYEDALQQDVQELHAAVGTQPVFLFFFRQIMQGTRILSMLSGSLWRTGMLMLYHNAADMYSGAPNHSYT